MGKITTTKTRSNVTGEDLLGALDREHQMQGLFRVEALNQGDEETAKMHKLLDNALTRIVQRLTDPDFEEPIRPGF